jgi:hypothetical protein
MLGLLTRGVHGIPSPGGELEVTPGVRVVEVVTGQIANPLQPVAQGTAMQRQRLGGVVVIAPAFQVAVQGMSTRSTISGPWGPAVRSSEASAQPADSRRGSYSAGFGGG